MDREFESWCTEYGLTQEQAKELAHALHVSGEILHFSTNPGLKDVIFLNPDAITGALADSLDIRYVQCVSILSLNHFSLIKARNRTRSSRVRCLVG